MARLFLSILLAVLAAAPARAQIELVSRSGPAHDRGLGEAQLRWYSGPWMSADGRYAAFDSYRLNLVAGQVDGYWSRDATWRSSAGPPSSWRPCPPVSAPACSSSTA